MRDRVAAIPSKFCRARRGIGRTCRLWLLCSLSCWLLAGGSSVLAQEPLIWGADAEGGAPYIFKDPDDPTRNIGFEVDLAEALSRLLQRPIVFKQYNYNTLILGLERGDFDFAMNGLEVTADRATRVRFSRPYFYNRLQLVARAQETRFQSLEELRKLRGVVGTLDDTAASRQLDALGIAAKYYDGQVEPYKNLELGRLDAVLQDLPIAQYYAQPNPKLKFVGAPTGGIAYAIAMRPGDEALATQIDRALEQLQENGELRAIYEKWRIWNEDQATLFRGEIPSGDQSAAVTRTNWPLRVYFPLMRSAAWVTIKLSVLSMALAMSIGLPIALARLYGNAPLRWLAVTYVEFFRGIPVLLLLYVLYYGLPVLLERLAPGLNFHPSDLSVAVLAFGMNYAAYEAEIYRAGISAIPRGQWEAAASLGLQPVTTFRRIILPQALRTITPPVTNDFVALFKDTSVVSAIAVVELTKQYQMLAKSSMKYFEIGVVTAVLYLLMSVPLGHLARHLEKRWGRSG